MWTVCGSVCVVMKMMMVMVIAGDIRLAGGTSESEGRVEVYVDGLWFSVCGDGWNTNHAAVVCRQLDYTT